MAGGKQLTSDLLVASRCLCCLTVALSLQTWGQERIFHSGSFGKVCRGLLGSYGISFFLLFLVTFVLPT